MPRKIPLKLVVSENRSNRSSGKSHSCNISPFRAIDVSNLIFIDFFYSFKLLSYVFTSFEFLLKVASGEKLTQKTGRATKRKKLVTRAKNTQMQLESPSLLKNWAIAAAIASSNVTHTSPESTGNTFLIISIPWSPKSNLAPFRTVELKHGDCEDWKQVGDSFFSALKSVDETGERIKFRRSGMWRFRKELRAELEFKAWNFLSVLIWFAYANQCTRSVHRCFD